MQERISHPFLLITSSREKKARTSTSNSWVHTSILWETSPGGKIRAGIVRSASGRFLDGAAENPGAERLEVVQPCHGAPNPCIPNPPFMLLKAAQGRLLICSLCAFLTELHSQQEFFGEGEEIKLFPRKSTKNWFQVCLSLSFFSQYSRSCYFLQ